jgi:hypothetical protein
VTQRNIDRGRDQSSWEQAVSRAEDHVRLEATGELDRDRALPGQRVLLVVAGLVVAVSVWLASPRLFRGPSVNMSPVEQGSDLRTEVGRLVEQIEAYRSERGTLPAPAMLAPFLDEGYEYRITDRNALRYEVRRSAGGVEVVYDGSLPLNIWLVIGGEEESRP